MQMVCDLRGCPNSYARRENSGCEIIPRRMQLKVNGSSWHSCPVRVDQHFRLVTEVHSPAEVAAGTRSFDPIQTFPPGAVNAAGLASLDSAGGFWGLLAGPPP